MPVRDLHGCNDAQTNACVFERRAVLALQHGQECVFDKPTKLLVYAEPDVVAVVLSRGVDECVLENKCSDCAQVSCIGLVADLFDQTANEFFLPANNL